MPESEPDPLKEPVVKSEWKIFDPHDPKTGSEGVELVDASVVARDSRWWLFLAGQPAGYGRTEIYSASLPIGAPLSPAGWTPTRNAEGQLIPVAGQDGSYIWDGKGGRHCPAHVKGWDRSKGEWVERIYYAGAAENLWGPYTIGYLEWNGNRWIENREPAFIATEDWEHGSVYEPNLIYHDGKWRMWYVAGSNHGNYIVHGYSESDDGVTGWSKHVIFAPPEMKMFDFCVRQRVDNFEAIFSRVWLQEGLPPKETGLWWCRAEEPSARLLDWGQPRQIMTAADRGWHSGPWKPSFAFDEQSSKRALLFFDGFYRTDDPGPFPFAFTLGCAELTFH